jgi:hypothetical protein
MEHQSALKLFQQFSGKMREKYLGTTDILKRQSGRGIRDTQRDQHAQFKNVGECKNAEVNGTDLIRNREAPAGPLHPTTDLSCDIVHKPITADQT